mmetsp:Transcript_11750/g.21681  ORF Transcript_11750/g.21681 Transcript_11750/m.21681 type:complete len:181 (+) Transcript_11750:1272-1814(+)
MDHHANMKITHKCVNGVDLELQFFSFEAKELTEKDFDAAKAVDTIHGGNQITMSDFSYNLDHNAIAKYPAEPRGSSKLLQVDPTGRVSFYDHFASSIPSLVKGCHVVFNNSKVLDARLSLKLENGNQVEMMLLDLGRVDADAPCSSNIIEAMIRSETVSIGDLCIEPVSGAKVEVVDICG